MTLSIPSALLCFCDNHFGSHEIVFLIPSFLFAFALLHLHLLPEMRQGIGSQEGVPKQCHPLANPTLVPAFRINQSNPHEAQTYSKYYPSNRDRLANADYSFPSTPRTLCTHGHLLSKTHRFHSLHDRRLAPTTSSPRLPPTALRKDRSQKIPISPRNKGRCAGSRLFLPRASNGLPFSSTAESARSCSILYTVTPNRQAWQDRPGQVKTDWHIDHASARTGSPASSLPFLSLFLPPVPILHPALLRIVQCDLSTCFTTGYRN